MYVNFINRTFLSFLIFSILLTGIEELSSGVNYKVLFPNGIKKLVRPTNINGTDYTDLKTLAGTIVPNSIVQKQHNAIRSSQGSMRFAPSSFFIVSDLSGMLRVAQMSMPSIYYNKKLLIPILPFFDSLEHLGIFAANINKDIITLSDYIPPYEEGIEPFPKLIRFGRQSGAKYNLESIERRLNELNLDRFPAKTTISGKEKIKESKPKEKLQKKNAATPNKKAGVIPEEEQFIIISPKRKKTIPGSYALPGNLRRKELDMKRE